MNETVGCIICDLESDGSELLQELAKGPLTPVEVAFYIGFGSAKITAGGRWACAMCERHGVALHDYLEQQDAYREREEARLEKQQVLQ